MPFFFLAAIFAVYFFGTKTGNPRQLKNIGSVKNLLGGAKEVYAIFQPANVEGPKFKKVTIDPRKVSLGDTQHLKVTMEKPEEVALVKAVTRLDSSTTTLVLSQNDGKTWSGEWIVKDTSTKEYRTAFIAQDKNGNESQFTMAWSDPCGFAQFGDSNLTSNCSFSGVGGAEDGILTLNGYTLTINAGATVAWPPGRIVTLNGTIAIANGGQLRQTNVWIGDVDVDGYYNVNNKVAQDSQPAGYVLSNSLTNGVCSTAYSNPSTLIQSCSINKTVSPTQLTAQFAGGGGYYPRWMIIRDANSVVINPISDNGSCANPRIQTFSMPMNQDYSYYIQQDYCSPGGCAGCGGNAQYDTGGSIPYTKSDCYDANANAYPQQTSFFSTNRGDGSFDYDCNGTQELQYPTVSSCGSVFICTSWDPESGACTGGYDAPVSTASTWNQASAPSCGNTGSFFTNTSCGTAVTAQPCR